MDAGVNHITQIDAQVLCADHEDAPFLIVSMIRVPSAQLFHDDVHLRLSSPRTAASARHSWTPPATTIGLRQRVVLSAANVCAG
jgi:hypothetical protein